MEADKAVSNLQNARQGAQQGAQGQRTRSRVCSTVTSAAQSACVFLQEHMGINNCAPATTTGRPREEAQNAHRICSKPTCIVVLFPIPSIWSLYFYER